MAGQTVPLTGELAAIAVKGRVSARDVLSLRRKVFADGVVCRNDLASLFALAEHAPDGDREWFDFFAEAVADYYLREEQPHGYLTQEEFAEIKAHVTRDGAAPSRLEIALMVKLIEDAVKTTAGMNDFVRKEITAMIAGKDGGPTVSEENAELIRRFLFAAGGDGALAITREEAEFLFDVNDLVAGAENHPAWSDLFIKAIANHLMAHVGYRPPSREKALARQAWLEDDKVDVRGFFGKMFSGGLSAIRDAYAREESAGDGAMASAETITGHEADWLAARIEKNASLDDNERALLAYMRELGADLPPKLKALAARAA